METLTRTKDPVTGTAVILTNGLLSRADAKTAHGLIRGTERFNILGVIDHKHAGEDAGTVLDGIRRDIPVYAGMEEFISHNGARPDFAVIGVALSGGRLDEAWQAFTLEILRQGVSIVSGMHMLLGDIPEFARAAVETGAEIIDVRRHKPYDQLHFWSGQIYGMKIPRIAVLGTDCALGKRTTSRLMVEACEQAGIYAEMIYTGQTGWLQGNPYGFILDTTINDFVSGEIEAAIVRCETEAAPDLIIVEGQSALRNPLGPCGSEIIVSGNVKGVVLQHTPFREFIDGTGGLGCRLPGVEEEIRLIEMYGSRVIAVTLNGTGGSRDQMETYAKRLEETARIPVIQPLAQGAEGMVKLMPVIREFIKEHHRLPDTTPRG